MCVALPGEVVDVLDGRARVRTASGLREVSCVALPNLREGEHVLISLGMALERISAEEAVELAALWADLAASEAREAGAS